MTIHVTQVEIDVAGELCKSFYLTSELVFMSHYNPVALAMSKHYRTQCHAFSDNVYIGARLRVTPTIVSERLKVYCTHGMKPFSFEIED